jgi:putative DNA primase/helicase
MKTPSLDEGTAHTRRLAAQARETYEASEAEREAELEVLKLERDKLKKGGRKDPKAIRASLIDLNQQLKDAEEGAMERRYVTNDATPEMLGVLLKQNKRGLMVIRDELIGLLKSFERPGREVDRAFFLEAHNGTNSFNVDRIGRGSLYIPALTLSVLGGIQPAKLMPFIYGALEGENDADGLLQRFQLMVWPDEMREWRNVDRWPDNAAKNRAFAVYKAIDELDPNALEEIEPGDVPALRFASDAQELFDGWRDELMQRLRGNELKNSPAFQAHLGKYPRLLAALALLFHLVDVVDGRAQGRISFGATALAVQWCIYLEQHARKIYAPEINAAVMSAHALAQKIQQGEVEDGKPLREVYRRQWAGLKTAEQVEGALAVLRRANWARIVTTEPGDKGGRPSELLRLHPELRGKS